YGRNGQARVNDQDIGLDRHQRDRREILDRIVGEAAVEALVGGEDAVVAEEPGMAVGRAFRGGLCGEVAAGAGAVVYHDLLRPAFRELLAEGAREDVARAAGREPDHKMYRLGGEGLAEGAARRQKDGAKKSQRPIAHGFPLAREGRRDYFATWRSRISSSVLQSMHSVAVGLASRRLRPISTPQLSQ